MSGRRIAFPRESQLYPRLGETWSHDAFETELGDPRLTPAGIARRALDSAPPWVEAMLALRDRIVRLFGLKAVGRLRAKIADGEPAIGDRFSIFTVRHSDPRELVLGIDDSHLDVRISFLKRSQNGPATYVVSSWVKTHNALGRFYMLPVAPFHRLIVRDMMRRAPM